MWRAAAGAALVLLAACADSADAPSDDAAPSIDGQSVIPLPAQARSLAAATYETARLVPDATFRLGDGWRLAAESAGFVHLHRGQDAAANCLCIVVPDGVYNAATGVPEPPPADYVAWLESHPLLETSNPSSLQVGNVPGQQMEVTAAQDAAPVPLVTAGQAMFTLAPGERSHIIVLDYAGTPVLIAARAPAVEFRDFFAAVEPVVGSLTLG